MVETAFRTGAPPLASQLGINPISNQEFVRAFLFTVIASMDGRPFLPGMELYTYSIDLPEILWEQVNLNIANAKFNIPGRQSITELRMAIYVVPSRSSQQFTITQANIDERSNLGNIESIYKLHNIWLQGISDRFVGKPLQITCKLFNVDATVIRQFMFPKAFLRSFKLNSMSWDSNDVLDMELVCYVNKVIII